MSKNIGLRKKASSRNTHFDRLMTSNTNRPSFVHTPTPMMTEESCSTEVKEPKIKNEFSKLQL